MREAERQKKKLSNLQKQCSKDKEELETRLSKLDTSYVSEFESRVKTSLAAAQTST